MKSDHSCISVDEGLEDTRLLPTIRGAGPKIFFRSPYVTSLRTTATALLQHVRERWSIENSWHWPRDTQLREDAHRYREVNGVQILATLRSLAMNALRLADFWSITEGLAALAHDIPGMLALLGWRQPAQALSSA